MPSHFLSIFYIFYKELHGIFDCLVKLYLIVIKHLFRVIHFVVTEKCDGKEQLRSGFESINVYLVDVLTWIAGISTRSYQGPNNLAKEEISATQNVVMLETVDQIDCGRSPFRIDIPPSQKLNAIPDWRCQTFGLQIKNGMDYSIPHLPLAN
jgi:hypothetical protein